MIKRAAFKNFKALRDVEVTFDSRLTVLVGPNGSGKTSVLQGIQVVGKTVHRERFQDETIVPKAVVANATIELTICDTPACTNSVTYTVKNMHKKRHPEDVSDALRVSLQALRDVVMLRLDPDQLKKPSVHKKKNARIEANGYGLPSALGSLDRLSRSKYEQIVGLSKHVIPSISSIRLDYDDSASDTVSDSIVFDFENVASVPASSVSDGTMVVLALVTSIVADAENGQLILLDDLDHRLHPKAQMALVDLLRKLLGQFPDLQIIATSHSPFILDRLEPNEVRVTGLRDDGSAAIARLEDAPEFDRWKESMTPGEFWSHMGDDWVKKVEPRTTAAAP